MVAPSTITPKIAADAEAETTEKVRVVSEGRKSASKRVVVCFHFAGFTFAPMS